MGPSIIREVFIDLIGDNKEIVLFSKTADLLEFGTGEYLAGWIARVGEKDKLCLCR